MKTKPINIRLDAEIVEHFRQGGGGYQSRIKAALREYVQAGTLAELVRSEVVRQQGQQEGGAQSAPF